MTRSDARTQDTDEQVFDGTDHRHWQSDRNRMNVNEQVFFFFFFFFFFAEITWLIVYGLYAFLPSVVRQ